MTTWTGETIRAAREKAGMSAQKLAAALGVTGNSIWNWETGRSNPRKRYHEKLAAVLGVPDAPPAPPGREKKMGRAKGRPMERIEALGYQPRATGKAEGQSPPPCVRTAIIPRRPNSIEAKYGEIGANPADPVGLRLLSEVREMLSVAMNHGTELDKERMWNLLYDADVAIRRLSGRKY